MAAPRATGATGTGEGGGRRPRGTARGGPLSTARRSGVGVSQRRVSVKLGEGHPGNAKTASLSFRLLGAILPRGAPPAHVPPPRPRPCPAASPRAPQLPRMSLSPSLAPHTCNTFAHILKTTPKDFKFSTLSLGHKTSNSPHSQGQRNVIKNRSRRARGSEGRPGRRGVSPHFGSLQLRRRRRSEGGRALPSHQRGTQTHAAAPVATCSPPSRPVRCLMPLPGRACVSGC